MNWTKGCDFQQCLARCWLPISTLPCWASIHEIFAVVDFFSNYFLFCFESKVEPKRTQQWHNGISLPLWYCSAEVPPSPNPGEGLRFPGRHRGGWRRSACRETLSAGCSPVLHGSRARPHIHHAQTCQWKAGLLWHTKRDLIEPSNLSPKQT